MLQRLFKAFKKAPPMSPFIKVADYGSGAIVTIDRPKALNAINREMFQ